MQNIQVNGKSGNSEILVGESYKDFSKYCHSHNIIIVTDKNVNYHYGKVFTDYPVIEIGLREKNKTVRTVERIHESMLSLEADRDTYLVGIGGGIVCDIAGYAAATYMRGIRFGFVATTLLAQVDASVGGKNGVNFHGYKNIIGTFKQPDFVICDPYTLDTLPQDELSNGFAEIIKHTLISDQKEFHRLQNNYRDALALKPYTINRLVEHSIRTKAAIVNRDELETGERKKLNFGHTFGHALEKVTGISHGKAVSIGMMVAGNISQQKGLIGSQELQQIEELLTNMKLPVTIDYDRKEVHQALINDKKRRGEHIHFVLLKGIGNAEIREVSLNELQDNM